MRYKIHHGDNLEWFRNQADNSLDSVVTDPPYGLGKEPDAVKMLQAWIDHGYLEVTGAGFMGKKWDSFVPQPIFWKEVYRVLKPGGHVVSFAGTRTYDWMVMAIRLAGFEIRDQLIWMYGGGFPKSANVSKMIDKQAGAKREVVGRRKHPTLTDTNKIEEQANASHGDNLWAREWDITAPATHGAQQWDGWGTALSPSHEPIVLARKPLEKGLTVAQNVLKWGCGALNIDASRIGTDRPASHTDPNKFTKFKEQDGIARAASNNADTDTNKGRWPSNLLLANVPSVLGLFPENAKSGKMGPQHTRHTGGHTEGDIYGKFKVDHPLAETIADSGSASRYFFRADLLPIEEDEINLPIHVKAYYCSKPSKYERNLGKETDDSHETVKPVALMHHLVVLVTPPNGICCDPFLGSGTTGIAAMLAGENIQFRGCEMTDKYIPISTNRIKNWKHYRQFVEAKKAETPIRKSAEASKQQSLF